VKELAKVANVKPIRIPGYWYHKEGSPTIGGTRSIDPKEKVIYMFHGGAYLALSANPKDDTQRITRDCLRVLPSELRIRRALSLEYRLSIGIPMVEVPQNPFPAALIDALTGYRHLVEDVGILPSNIILVGDSAGANLALALTRYLKETGIFQIPGGMILLSPWVDLGTSHAGPTSSRTTNVSSDYLGPPDHLDPSLLYATGAFAGPHPRSVLEENIYISPASKNIPEKVLREAFVGFPRTLVVSGSGEQLLDSIETLAKRMEKDMGPEKLKYLMIEDAFHDFMAVPWTGPDRLVCLEKIQEWGKSL
jgi:acetyl esterase/lipase